jgi:hypothetical protein
MERAAEAAAELFEDNPLLKKPYDPQIVVDRIKQLLAARKRKSDCQASPSPIWASGGHSGTFLETPPRWFLGGSFVHLGV